MAYSDTRYEIQLISGGDANSTGTVGSRSCGNRPFLVRRAAVLVTDALDGAVLVVTFSKRVTPGTDAGGTTIGTITMLTGLAAGTLYRLDNLTTEIGYGEQVYAAVTTAVGTSGSIDVLVDVEDRPSNPAASSISTLVTS